MMNSSAKILFTLVAAGALGAVALACTVSSGTVDNTDGGSSSGQASSSSSSSGTTTTTDGGQEAAAEVCQELTFASAIDSQACDQCLRTSCCSQTAACWNKADKDTEGKLGCDDYQTQLLDCDKDEATAADCKKLAKSAAQDGIPAAYDGYLGCRYTNCASACGHDTELPPDGGAP